MGYRGSEVSICTFYTRVIRIFIVLTFLRMYEAILADLKIFKSVRIVSYVRKKVKIVKIRKTRV